MAVSTSQDFNLDIDEIIAEAYEHLGGPPFVGNDGITARRSLNLLLSDWQNRGILLWTTQFTNQTMTSGTEEYTLAETVMAVTEAVSRRDSADISMTRISAEEYLKVPDKTTQGRCLQYATMKGRDAVSVLVWPAPENSTDLIRMHSVSGTLLGFFGSFQVVFVFVWFSLGFLMRFMKKPKKHRREPRKPKKQNVQDIPPDYHHSC